MRILFITVGGSDPPIVTSINNIRPDKVVFFCTTGKVGSRITVDGDGLVCGDYVNGQRVNTRPNIMIQTELDQEQAMIVEVEGDNPFDTYSKALEVIEQYPRDEILIDYTGGTKSMTAGLYSASTEVPNSNVVLVTGLREDMDKVRGNYSRVLPLAKNTILGQRRLKLAESFVEKQDYEGALFIINELTTLEGISSETILDQYRYLLTAFAKWDNFEYEKAKEVLELYTKGFTPNAELIYFKNMIKKLVEAKELFLNDNQRKADRQHVLNGLWVVYDLLKNAERKASHKHYDDAVSRIYRATEMYAQYNLLSLEIDTSNVDLAKLQKIAPERLAYYDSRKNDKNQIQIGLRDSYDLLSDLGHPVGQIWVKHKNELTNALTTRNYSFLAHGMNPITKEDYEALKTIIWQFIKQCDQNNADLAKKKIGMNYYQGLPDDLRRLI